MRPEFFIFPLKRDFKPVFNAVTACTNTFQIYDSLSADSSVYRYDTNKTSHYAFIPNLICLF